MISVSEKPTKRYDLSLSSRIDIMNSFMLVYESCSIPDFVMATFFFALFDQNKTLVRNIKSLLHTYQVIAPRITTMPPMKPQVTIIGIQSSSNIHIGIAA